jgi:hypothetical protein
MRVIGKGVARVCWKNPGWGRVWLLAVLVAMTGCQGLEGGEDLTVGTSFSALPNIGLSLDAGQVFERSAERTWGFELEWTHQPWDDEDLLDDGNPHAGTVSQVQVGVKRTSDPMDSLHWTQRYGVGWMRVRGEPNILQEAGDYEVLYAGWGFETHLSESVSMGPEFSLMLAVQEKTADVFVVPQFNWHISWGF